MKICPRLEREKLEHDFLMPFASFSDLSRDRVRPEESCNIRTEFQKDRDRILHSKAFRRAKHKTQVFIAPEGDHYRTRLTHALEVSQIGRTIARALRLNEDLVEAVGLAHDLGHTPFGHTGERVLDKLNPNGFKHYEQSLRVLDFLEYKSSGVQGLNLTNKVRDGIVMHTGDAVASTLEGFIIKFADRIAYINHDIDDAIRAKLLKLEDIPKKYLDLFGVTHGQRINFMINNIIETSYGKNKVEMSPEIYEAMMELRKFMFDNVYFSDEVLAENKKAEYIVQELYNYFLNNTEAMGKTHLKHYENTKDTDETKVCDYIAGMTDRFAINLFNDLFIPKSWHK